MNPEMFVSKQTGVALNHNNYQTYVRIPKQLPKEVTEESLNSLGKNTEVVMNSVLIIQLISQLAMKALLDYLMLLFFVL
jgi:hypothetical protein